MSRSRKKTPSTSDYHRNYTSWSKRQASKAVRRYKDILINGAHYKKVYPTWDIFDYKFTYYQSKGRYLKGINKDIPRKAYMK